MSQQSFADLGVGRAVTGALTERGFTTPFAIQRLVLPDALAGRDLLVQSPTGLRQDPGIRHPDHRGQLKIGVSFAPQQRWCWLPTRELAIQVVRGLEHDKKRS